MCNHENRMRHFRKMLQIAFFLIFLISTMRITPAAFNPFHPAPSIHTRHYRGKRAHVALSSLSSDCNSFVLSSAAKPPEGIPPP